MRGISPHLVAAWELLEEILHQDVAVQLGVAAYPRAWDGNVVGHERHSVTSRDPEEVVKPLLSCILYLILRQPGEIVRGGSYSSYDRHESFYSWNVTPGDGFITTIKFTDGLLRYYTYLLRTS